MYLFLPDWPIDRRRRSGGAANRASGISADAAPFATVVETGGRRLLAAVNPLAAAAGLAPGMPLADALSFLPGLVTAPAEPALDGAALTRLAEWCGRYSPWTAPDGTDGVKIEITGSAHLWSGEAALAADLSGRLARPLNFTGGIAHRIAIAGTLGAAWALARFAATAGRPALPAPEEERAALAPLPVEALRLDPLTAAGLRRVGLRHVGELYPMPRDALARRFGDAVARRLDQAFGDMSEPLAPLGETPSRRVRLSFAEPIADPADLACAIERLVADLVPRLAREGVGARRLDLAFYRVDGRVEHISLGTARPTRDPRHLAGLLTVKLDTVDLGDDPGLGVEDMILAVFAVEKLPPEQAEFVAGDPKTAAHDIGSLLDRLGNRFGLDAISRIEARASHIPECASVCVPVGGSPHPPAASVAVLLSPQAGEGQQIAAGKANSLPRKRGRVGVGAEITPGKPPRPVRLFQPPEPVEAQWVLPDDPPFRFVWRRRWHRVLRADGPERIAEEWWTEGGSAAADAIRDYYRVEDEAGRRFWLFRAGLAGDPPPCWFVHGVFA
jgi:protein ImuB